MTEHTYDAALSLLDRQIVAADDRLVGKVDDVAIEQDESGHWCVTDLLVGPAALGPRTGGLLGHWMSSVWTRLASHPQAGPARVHIDKVDRIESAVHLTVSRDEAGLEGFETWVREKVVEHIPGHQ